MTGPLMRAQVRIGGCKGMLTAWPKDVMNRVCGSSGYDIAVRPSLRKFESQRNDLEVREFFTASLIHLVHAAYRS